MTHQETYKLGPPSQKDFPPKSHFTSCILCIVFVAQRMSACVTGSCVRDEVTYTAGNGKGMGIERGKGNGT